MTKEKKNKKFAFSGIFFYKTIMKLRTKEQKIRCLQEIFASNTMKAHALNYFGYAVGALTWKYHRNNIVKAMSNHSMFHGIPAQEKMVIAGKLERYLFARISEDYPDWNTRNGRGMHKDILDKRAERIEELKTQLGIAEQAHTGRIIEANQRRMAQG